MISCVLAWRRCLLASWYGSRCLRRTGVEVVEGAGCAAEVRAGHIVAVGWAGRTVAEEWEERIGRSVV